MEARLKPKNVTVLNVNISQTKVRRLFFLGVKFVMFMSFMHVSACLSTACQKRIIAVSSDKT